MFSKIRIIIGDEHEDDNEGGNYRALAQRAKTAHLTSDLCNLLSALCTQYSQTTAPQGPLFPSVVSEKA